MAGVFFSDYVDKLMRLEKCLGIKAKYTILEPFPVDPRDIIGLNRAAMTIRDFVGLTGITFVVVTDELKKGQGGTIQLKQGEVECDVLVSESVARSSEATLATLAHEITHKYLHIHGIHGQDSYHNEVLTDIGAVFLGLGKLMLNGCLIRFTTHKPVARGTVQTEHTQKVGYLDHAQLAFVYLLACAMREVPESVYCTGLNSYALSDLESCKHEYTYLFQSGRTFQERIAVADQALRKHVDAVQRILSELEDYSVYVRHAFHQKINEMIRLGHKELVHMQMEAENNDVNELDPCVRHLHAAAMIHSVQQRLSMSEKTAAAAGKMVDSAREIAQEVFRHNSDFPGPMVEMFNYRSCPIDGQPVRLPVDQGTVAAQCASCGYRFRVNTSPNLKLQQALEEAPVPRTLPTPGWRKFLRF